MVLSKNATAQRFRTSHVVADKPQEINDIQIKRLKSVRKHSNTAILLRTIYQACEDLMSE